MMFELKWRPSPEEVAALFLQEHCVDPDTYLMLDTPLQHGFIREVSNRESTLDRLRAFERAAIVLSDVKKIREEENK